MQQKFVIDFYLHLCIILINKKRWGNDMRKYRCENWVISDIAKAMKGYDEEGRKIVIPIYQRGKRWSETNDKKESKERRQKLIDSLLKDYPIGALLFAERGDKTYSIIDGLQRSITLCDYILFPTRRENLKDVDDNTLTQCKEILFPGNSNEKIKEALNSLILSCIETKKNFNELTAFEIANTIIENMASNVDYKIKINGLVSILQPWFENYKRDFDTISKTEIPVIIYTGGFEKLNEVFK